MTESLIEKIEKLAVPSVGTKQINLKEVHWIIDPLQEDQIKERMSQSASFAEALMKNKSELFFQFLQHKAGFLEPTTLEIKGATRSGKSTFGTATCKFIAHLTMTSFTIEHICANEIIYLERLKTMNPPDGSAFQIDEQTETHAGAGSYTEMQVLEDITNICAKKAISTVWCHPHEFVGRMGQIGIELYGKCPELKLLRGIMYNIAQKSMLNSPVGIIVMPVGWLFPCGLFGQKTMNYGVETIITCNPRVCPRYKKCDYFMGQYEHQKDQKIEEVMTQSLHDREFQRLQIIERLANNPAFQKCKKNDERMAVARLLVPLGSPEKLIQEYISIAKSTNINIADLKEIAEQQRKEMEELK